MGSALTSVAKLRSRMQTTAPSWGRAAGAFDDRVGRVARARQCALPVSVRARLGVTVLIAPP
eukprot:4697737-Pyramimonas_sp.AAC.1